MIDTLIIIILIIACIAMIALSALLIYDISREFIEDQRAAKRREELIEIWANMDLSKQCIYTDTDSTYYKGGYTHSYNVWSKMRTSCWHLYDKDMCYCHADDFNYCDYKRCPLIHEEKDNGN